MKVFLDINVVMDYFLVRDHHFRPAAEIFTLAKRKQIEAIVDARTIVFTFFHLRKKTKSYAKAKSMLKSVLADLTIVSLTRSNLEDALEREKPADLEDGAQLEMAISSKADILLSGGKKGFKTDEIKVMSVPEFLTWYAKRQA